MNAGQIYEYIDSIAPFCRQEDWDNSGFQVGERAKEVHKILFALDATADLVREAHKKQCDLIVTHHPFLFQAQKQFTEQNPAYLAAKYNIAVISAHTSFDCADGVLHVPVAVSLPQKEIKVVAVCGGAAMDFALEAQTAGADMYFTGDAKHHEILDAAEYGLSVAAAGHFQTEYPAVVSLKNRVQAQFPEISCVLSAQTAPTVTV